MNGPNSERPELVGVESRDNVQQLVRTAGDLPRFGAGTVRLVTAAVKGSGPRQGVDRTERTVIATPSGDAAVGPLARFGGLLRR